MISVWFLIPAVTLGLITGFIIGFLAKSNEKEITRRKWWEDD